MWIDHYDSWRDLLERRRLPAAVVALDVLERNTRTIERAMAESPQTIRVASKSVRVPAVMRHIASLSDRILGVMTFSIFEVAVLREFGFDDFLMGYPFASEPEVEECVRLVADGVTVRPIIDSRQHIDMLGKRAREANVTIEVCLDIDVSLRLLKGRVHLGSQRSPVRDVKTALDLARLTRRTEGLRLTSLLAYEGQVAGIPDRNPHTRHLDPVRQLIKRRSVPAVSKFRGDVVDALRRDGHSVELVNGGGTGSTSSTSRDRSVTELTVGSGFLCSHLFENYHDLDLWPAAFFALSIVRMPDDDHVTCAAGGYIASGATGADRSPVVHRPRGLEPLGMEGFGEVQTPMARRGSCNPGIGDPVICRHAKAGELFERFDKVLLVRDGVVEEEVPTYRGLGHCFM